MNILDEIEQTVESLTERVSTWLDQQTCKHPKYRPGLVKGKPGRICSQCTLAEQVSEDAFYAQFGEKAMAEVKKRQEARKPG